MKSAVRASERQKLAVPRDFRRWRDDAEIAVRKMRIPVWMAVVAFFQGKPSCRCIRPDVAK